MEVQISETVVTCDKNIGRHVALIYTCTLYECALVVSVCIF